MFINIHTHLPSGKQEKTILNLYRDFETVKSSGYYSIGIHPWYIPDQPDELFMQLSQIANTRSVVAIGETGLDKICKTEWTLQEKVFRLQLQLAGQLQKPLIIHCVQAWGELLKMLEEEQVSVPVIFHGYIKGVALARQLTAKGYYLSFGKGLEKENVRQVLKSIPTNLFFLETDDAPISIREVYERAAQALSIDLNTLDLQIQQNLMAVFGPKSVL